MLGTDDGRPRGDERADTPRIDIEDCLVFGNPRTHFTLPLDRIKDATTNGAARAAGDCWPIVAGAVLRLEASRPLPPKTSANEHINVRV